MSSIGIEVHACAISEMERKFYWPAGMITGIEANTPNRAIYNVSQENFTRVESEKHMDDDDYRVLTFRAPREDFRREERVFPFVRVYNMQVHKKGWGKWFCTGELYVDINQARKIRESWRKDRR